MEWVENENTEFKQGFSEEIKKTVVAFANTKGGDILVGVDDDGSVIGIGHKDETLLQVSSSIRDGIKPDITLFVSYKFEEIEKKQVLHVHVDKGTGSPYYLAQKGLRPSGVYVRYGAASVPATESAIRQMIKETDGDRS
jgi:ATP-dependent DNA helicase RecG